MVAKHLGIDRFYVKSELVNVTVWKFHNFYITQILRETKVSDFRGPKSAILTNLDTLIFYLYEFLHLLKA